MPPPRGTSPEHSIGHEAQPAWSQQHREEPFEALPTAPTLQFKSSCSKSSRGASPYPLDGYVSGQGYDPEIYSMIVGKLRDLFGEDSEEERIFFSVPQICPITKDSLSELDIGSIINNSKLRHDVNFDRELHFRPNMDGERGHRKRHAQIRYWKAISIELHLIYHVLRSELGQSSKASLIKTCSCRLRAMFENIKKILKNLVPERDQSDVDEHLDVPMIMQQISRGVCNFVSMSEWMAQLLKKHCAPMRDELVERMVKKIAMETEESIASGLADLFTVLEAMKLDVANHQIRHLRALLIEDSINFERKYHCSRIRKQRYDCKAARLWYTSTRDGMLQVPLTNGSRPNRDVDAFVHGLVRLLLPTTDRVPDTFALDVDRIRQLREDVDEIMRDTICSEVLAEVLCQRGFIMSQALEVEFRQRLQSISGGPRPPKWHQHAIDDIAVEIVRFTLRTTGNRSLTDADLVESVCDTLTTRLWATVRARHVHDHPVEDREEQTRVMKMSEQLYEQLYSQVFRMVEKYISSSPHDVFQALVPPSAPPSLCPVLHSGRTSDRHQDIVRRIAHIAILHWRTWEHLVYNNEDFDGENKAHELAGVPNAPVQGSQTIRIGSPYKTPTLPSVHSTDVETVGDGSLKAPAG